MRRLALRSALSAKAAAEQIVILDQLAFEAPKTIEILQLLDNLEIAGSAVVLLPERNENVEKSARNLPDVKMVRANYLNIRDLLGHNYIIMTKDTVSTIESFLGQ
jgi:large subunit ribosomal protein L4